MKDVFSKIDPTLTIEKITSCTENQYFDRKSARIATRDFAHHLSAFANASGGVIVVGVEDNGNITGVSDDERNNFRKAVREFLLVSPKYEVEEIKCLDIYGNDTIIMLFHIDISADEIICMKNGDAYLRVGDSSKKLSPSEFTSLEYSRGIKSFESRIIDDAFEEDLNLDLIEQYMNILNIEVSSWQDVFKARGLLKRKNDQWKFTAAAILLFGKIPTQFFTCARVRFLRYEGINAGVGTNMNLVKDITIEKPLPILIEETQKLLQSQMREFQRLGKNGKFIKVPEYPDFAWLEGLVNAVTHRDYSIQGDYIKIEMYDDRLEFKSPGRLPSIVTVENIQSTRFSRNPVIARILSDFGWVRELNEGVKRIYTDMSNYFLEPPEFSEPNNNTVKLVLKNNLGTRSLRNIENIESRLQFVWTSLKPLDRNIVFYVANAGSCTPSKLMGLTGKARPTIQTHIKKLIEMGILEEHATSTKDPTKYFTIKS